MKAILFRLAIVLVSFGLIAGTTSAQPPMTSGSSWLKTPNWSLPSMPWSQAKPPAKKKSPGMMSQINKSTQQSWNRTKRALDPSWMFPSDSKPNKTSSVSRNKPAKQNDGMFSGWFGGKEDKELNSVNDFLAQPRPQ